MPYYEFLWTEETIEHVLEHDVSQDEFERIVRSPHSTSASYSSGLPAAFGFADDGRLIICVYEHLDSVLIMPVTAYEI
jgi:hypothetical protein